MLEKYRKYKFRFEFKDNKKTVIEFIAKFQGYYKDNVTNEEMIDVYQVKDLNGNTGSATGFPLNCLVEYVMID